MFTVLLDTKDLGEAESVLSANISKMRIRTACADESALFRIERAFVGSIAFDSAECGIDFSYEMAPPDNILLCRVVSGGLQERPQGRSAATYRTGEAGVIGANSGVPCEGKVQQGHYEQLLIKPSLLSSVAAERPGSDKPVRLTGSVPISREASRQLSETIGYVGRVAASRHAQENRLIASGVERYVASTLLATLPNTARSEPTRQERRDSSPVLLRRAVAYVEDNAHDDITLTDIATAVYVTPRALQYMFRKYRHCTPTEYLRRVRLQRAHLDLVAADHSAISVGDIARRWGFGHLGRFSVLYRQTYGRSPHLTLRG
ncbi:helix-turn-helix transcriptional regulator [Mycobacterium asiaticum]|uniref:HTH araC/xylS-type domain-containing protein n=1 Tax=Mycobacterium asiaticum TaxID=1790 RepID=A0A1A3N4V6_MYCAS|nr:helix-turn-helix transcriptional regulator [Mycobacterium asiaticum]OBK16370.1 hypothetical protein A5636_03475 [Mycobacterium asiaticum]